MDPLTGSFVTERQFADTETFGLEFEGFWTPVELFELSATFTWQDAQFEDFAFSGNQPIRISGVRSLGQVNASL